jgi:hypothetical protein
MSEGGSFWESYEFQLAFTAALLVGALYLVVTGEGLFQLAGGSLVGAYALAQLYMLLRENR